MVCMLKIELITINTFVNIDIYGTYYEKKNFFPLFQAFLVLAKAPACYRFFVLWGNKVYFYILYQSWASFKNIFFYWL